MSKDINIGAISEALNNKLDRGLNNRQVNNQFIIKTFVDGTSGYRIWSDGYCEQWGSFENTSGTITFAKTFKDTDYCIIGSPNGSTAKGEGTINIYSKTVSDAKYGTSINSSGMYGFAWRAFGYLAEGQY